MYFDKWSWHIIEVLANNYEIVSVDIDSLTIEIKANYGTTFKSMYTSKCEYYNYNKDDISFVEVVENDGIKELKYIYNIGAEKPFSTSMIFENNGFALVFSKDETNEFKKRLTIKYMIYENGKYKPLFTNYYEINDGKTCERIYTFDNEKYYGLGNLVDKSTYVVNDNLIYVINDLESKKRSSYIKAVFFESLDVDVESYEPNIMDLSIYEELIEKNALSAFLFKGVIGMDFCLLKIYKTNEKIYIKYYRKDIYNEDKEVYIETNEIPVFEEGKITDLEIYKISSLLNYKEEFISVILPELNSIFKKLSEKYRKMEEFYTILSPKSLINMDFKLIAEKIIRGKNECFSYMREHFEDITESKVLTK